MKRIKFSYGEELGIKSFFQDIHARFKGYEDTTAKFGYGSDNVVVTPDGTGDGINVDIHCVSANEKFAIPDMKFNVKYGLGGDATCKAVTDRVATILCNIQDILESRKSIVNTLTADLRILA